MVDVQNPAPVRLAPEIVRAVSKDPELRSLRPGSAEYKTAFEKKFPNETKPVASETTGSKPEKVETKSDEVPADKTATSTDDDAGLAKGPRGKTRIKELIRESTELKARIAELETAGKTPKQAEKQAEAETRQAPSSGFDKPKPKAADFKDLSDFNEALNEWQWEKRDFEREQAGKQKTATEQANKAFADFNKKGTEFAKEAGVDQEEFDLVVNEIKLYPASRYTVVNSEFGPQIAYEIGSNDEMKAKFEKMSELQQVTFIGRLEAKFEAKKEASTESSKPVSGAKAPGKPLQKGTSGPTTGVKLAPKDFKAYEAMRKEQQPNKFKR